jgi:benzodiazapine receptor
MVTQETSYTWYQHLSKPSWAPPSWLFGPVWSVLYLIIAASFGYVGYLATKRAIPLVVVLPFVLNLVFNFSFTPLQFGLRNNMLAAVDILLVLITLIWLMFAIWPYAHWVALANIPYLVWVCFATILQLTITAKNL